MKALTLEHNLADDELEKALEKALRGVRKARSNPKQLSGDGCRYGHSDNGKPVSCW
jgi:hypothetical protein